MKSVLDDEIVTELAQLMQEGFPSLVERFVMQSQRYSDAIAQAAMTHDLPAIEAAAHPLASSCRQMGCVPLWQLALTVEEAARMGGATHPQMQQWAAALPEALEQAGAALRQWLLEHPHRSL